MYLFRSIFRFLGGAWLILFVVFALLGVALEVGKHGMWAGVAIVGNVLDPFRIGNYIAVVILVSPAILFFWLAEKFPKRPEVLTQSSTLSKPSRLKNTIGLLALIIVVPIGVIYVGLTWYRELIRPYTWSEPIVEDAKSKGWHLVVERKGSSIMPWTWIKPFPRVLGLVHIDSVRQKGTLILAPMIWVIRDQEDDRIEPFKRVHFFNCSTKRYTIMAEHGEAGEIFDTANKPVEKNWRDMDSDLISYFCKS